MANRSMQHKVERAAQQKRAACEFLADKEIHAHKIDRHALALFAAYVGGVVKRDDSKPRSQYTTKPLPPARVRYATSRMATLMEGPQVERRLIRKGERVGPDYAAM